MTHRWTISCGLALALLAGLAFAERATALLDDVETALESAAAEFAEDTTKDGKKRFKAATKSLKKLGKDTTSELGDIKLLKKIAGATLKRFADDAAVVQPIVDAADAFDESIDDTLDAARALVPASPAKKVKPAQVTKAIERAQKLLDKSRAKDTKPRIAVLFKARKAADKAFALAGKLEPLEQLRFDAQAYMLHPNGAGVARLMSVDLDTGAMSELDTGAGLMDVESPRPVSSPDGSVGAFQQGSRMVFLDTTADQVATATGGIDSDWEYSSWSPAGTVLIASGRDPDKLAVFDGAGNTVHSFDERVYRGFPEEQTFLWSHDGALVAYRTDRNTNGVRELRVLNVATGVITEVTSADLSTDQIRYVAWAGTSNRLVYPANFDRSSSDTELMVVNADGTGRMVISQSGQDVRDAGSNINTLNANPVGDGVLYEFQSGGVGFLGTVNFDGTAPEVIATASANFINAHAWSPDGSRIAYVDSSSLYSCRPDGSDTVLVTDSCPDFRWAPDGSALIYRDGFGSFATDLFVCEPNGANPVRISPALVGGGNVEPKYGATVSEAGLAVHFVADSDENNRPDFHVVLVRDDGPGKLNAPFRKRLTSASRFSSGDDELKSVKRELRLERKGGSGTTQTVILYYSVEICISGSTERTVEHYKFVIEQQPLLLIPLFAVEVPSLTRLTDDPAVFSRILVDAQNLDGQ